MALPEDIKAMVRLVIALDEDSREKGLSCLEELFRSSRIPSQVFTRLGMMIIWKGLFCAMVHQPEPLLQEKLADRIAKLIYHIKNEERANFFLKCAFETFNNEWEGVNQFCYDKMMMFFRRVLRHALFRLADQNWTHSDKFMAMLERTVIKPVGKDDTVLMDLKFHLNDIFLEELSKASNESLDHPTIMVFLSSFIKVLVCCHDNEHVANVIKNIFENIIRQSNAGIDNLAYLKENEFLVDEQGNKYRDYEKSTSKREVSDEEACEDMSDDDLELEPVSDADKKVEIISDTDEEEDQEYPLDPRAGNVDVILPQLDVDFDDLASKLLTFAYDAQVNNKRRRKICHLVNKLQDVSHGVYPLGSHPSIRPVHNLAKDNMKEIDVEEAVQKRLRLHENELKTDRQKGKNMTMKDLERIYSKTIVFSRQMAKERSNKFKIIQDHKRKIEEKRNERRFENYAKRTLKLKQKLEKRRLKAKGIVVNEDMESRLAALRSAVRSRTNMKMVSEVVGRGNNNHSELSSCSAGDGNNNQKGVKAEESINSDNNVPKKKKRKENLETDSMAVKKKSKVSKSCVISKLLEHAKETGVQDAIEHTKSTDKKLSKNTGDQENVPNISKKVAVKKKAQRKMSQGIKSEKKRTEIVTAPTTNEEKIYKKINSALKQKSSGIKISLKNNKHHEFKDYHRDVLASPAIPFQPEKIPPASVLKASPGPILVKKPFIKTLKNIPSRSKQDKDEIMSSTVKTEKRAKSKAVKSKKVSAAVLKALTKRNLSISGLNIDKKSSGSIRARSSALNKGDTVLHVQSVDEQVTQKRRRPTAADFF